MTARKLSITTPRGALAWITFWFAVLAGSAWCVGAVYGAGALALVWIAAGAAYNFRGVSQRLPPPRKGLPNG